MILEKETYEKFGYYPSDLTPHSNKKILAKCDKCGKIRELGKDYYRPICKSCVNKGNGNPFFGKKHSKESKQEISKHRGDISGENNPNWKGGKVERICKKCGCVFKIPPAWIKTGAGKHCSRSCARKNIRYPKHHTKPERIFEEICKKNNLPFKYTGDGAFWIGENPSINPDFVECDGKKLAIFVNGDYWHSPLLRYNIRDSQKADYQIKQCKNHRWIAVIFWESDLKRKDAEQFVLNTLKKFL